MKAVVISILLLPLVFPLVNAQVFHPASEIRPGNFTGDFRITGVLTVGDLSGGLVANNLRTALVAPDGSVKLSVYNDRIELGTGLKFSDGTVQTSAATDLWSQNGTTIYYNEGKVGVGESDSHILSKLTVRRDVDSTAIGSGIVLALHNRDTTNNNRAEIQFSTSQLDGEFSHGPIIAAIFPNRHATLGHDGELAFFTNGIGGGSSEVLRLTKDQLIGIGTSAPTEKLTVAGGNVFIASAGQGIKFADGSLQTTASTKTQWLYGGTVPRIGYGGGGTTYYSHPLGQYNSNSPQWGSNAWRVPAAGKLTKFEVVVSKREGQDGNMIFTLQKNDVDTALTVTITPDDAVGQLKSVAVDVTVSTGDQILLEHNTSSGTANNLGVEYRLLYTED